MSKSKTVDNAAAAALMHAVDDIIRQICPSARRRKMYGGIVFEKEANNPKTSVCGHFVHKTHVSLEFSEGSKLSDPDTILEGNGKYRRHIKLRNPEDLESKRVFDFLERAFR